MDARMTKELIKDFSGNCFEALCRTLLSLLLMVLLTGMAFSIMRAGFDLLNSADLYTAAGLHTAIKELIINVLMVLALLELFRTVKAYFTEGRIKVTYIIDTALVVVITDIMGFWYREIEVVRVALAIALVLALMGVRIMAILYSPRRSKLLEEL
jgi:uncharacterized membrane protein (DUF373 family)